MAYYYHETPGRLRVRIPDMRRNLDLAEEVKDHVLSIQGVRDCRVSLISGSAVIRFRRTCPSARILRSLHEAGLFDMDRAATSKVQIKDRAANICAGICTSLAKTAVKAALSASPLSPLAVLL